jgi:hypothetical protein
MAMRPCRVALAIQVVSVGSIHGPIDLHMLNTACVVSGDQPVDQEDKNEPKRDLMQDGGGCHCEPLSPPK